MKKSKTHKINFENKAGGPNFASEMAIIYIVKQSVLVFHKIKLKVLFSV